MNDDIDWSKVKSEEWTVVGRTTTENCIVCGRLFESHTPVEAGTCLDTLQNPAWIKARLEKALTEYVATYGRRTVWET